MDDKLRKKHEDLYNLGVFMPLRTCPLRNGIGLDEGGIGEDGWPKVELKNWCHDGCAWAVKDSSTVHEDGITAHRGHCGIIPEKMKQE